MFTLNNQAKPRSQPPNSSLLFTNIAQQQHQITKNRCICIWCPHPVIKLETKKLCQQMNMIK